MDDECPSQPRQVRRGRRVELEIELRLGCLWPSALNNFFGVFKSANNFWASRPICI